MLLFRLNGSSLDILEFTWSEVADKRAKLAYFPEKNATRKGKEQVMILHKYWEIQTTIRDLTDKAPFSDQ